MARRVLEEHSGTMELSNREEGGLEVTMALPLAGSVQAAEDRGGEQ